MDEWMQGALALAKEFEGCRLEAYPDPSYGWKVATIGWGATGPAITQGVVWTQEEADADLESRMAGCGEIVDRFVTFPVTADMKAALSDFIYNVGAGAFETSTLLRKLNGGDVQGAADEFPRWNLSNGHLMPGLVKRRAAERALFLSEDGQPGEAQTQTEESQ
jgi:lysozyme